MVEMIGRISAFGSECFPFMSNLGIELLSAALKISRPSYQVGISGAYFLPTFARTSSKCPAEPSTWFLCAIILAYSSI